GLLVFGKTSAMASALKNQFAARKPRREYMAVVAGELSPREGRFETYLATAGNLDRYSTRDRRKGELAVTHYEVEAQANGATIVRVRLETGRRNQIRVHFAEAGHPVLGDPRYRTDLAVHPRWSYRRLALH